MKSYQIIVVVFVLALLAGGCQQSARAPGAAAFKVVCLGDEVTGPAELERRLKWPELLDVMLGAHSGGGRAAALNRGAAAETSGEIRARLEADVLAERPDVVVVLAGGNDAVDKDETRENLAAIVQSLDEAGARVLLLSYHGSLDVEEGEEDEGRWDVHNRIIAEVAQDLGRPLLDMRRVMKAALLDYRRGQLVAADGVTLRPAGERAYAEAVFGELQRLGWLPRRDVGCRGCPGYCDPWCDPWYRHRGYRGRPRSSVHFGFGYGF